MNHLCFFLLINPHALVKLQQGVVMKSAVNQSSAITGGLGPTTRGYTQDIVIILWVYHTNCNKV